MILQWYTKKVDFSIQKTVEYSGIQKIVEYCGIKKTVEYSGI